MHFHDVNSTPVAAGDNIVFTDQRDSNRVDSPLTMLGLSRGTITDITVNDSEMCSYDITINRTIAPGKTDTVAIETTGRYLDWIVKV